MENEDMAVEKIVPAGKVFTFRRALVCSMLLGGPLTISYIASKNYQVFGEHKTAKETMISGLVLTMVLITILILFPNERGLTLSLPAITYGLALMYMKSIKIKGGQDKINEHIDAGGQTVGWGKTVIVCAVGSILTLGIHFSISFPIEWYRNSTNEVRKDLVSFSKNLQKLKKYENIAVNKYNNMDKSNIYDTAVYNALNTIIVPNYEKYYAGIIEIRGSLKTSEVMNIYEKLKNCIDNHIKSFYILKEAIENGDNEKLDLFNEMFSDSCISINEYVKEYKELRSKNGLE